MDGLCKHKIVSDIFMLMTFIYNDLKVMNRSERIKEEEIENEKSYIGKE